jgi:hypothetical protein
MAETLTRVMDLVSFARMSNVLEQTKQQQVLALGRLGWPASRIAAAMHVDRATVTGLSLASSAPSRGDAASRVAAVSTSLTR